MRITHGLSLLVAITMLGACSIGMRDGATADVVVTGGATASVAVTDGTEAMVGRWGMDGEVCLIVLRTGDRIILAAPENDAWRMDISAARLDGDSVCYVQRNYLRSHQEHPFNGVACNTRIRLVDADTMEMKLTTVQAPDLEAAQLVRIK